MFQASLGGLRVSSRRQLPVRARRDRPLLALCAGQGRAAFHLRPDPARCRHAASSSAATPGEQARKCLENLRAIASDAGGSLEDAVKVTVYLTDIAAFAEVNEVYASVLQERPAGARGDGGGGAAEGRPGGDRRCGRAWRLSADAGASSPRRASGGRACRRRVSCARRRSSPRARSPSGPGTTVVLKAENLQGTGSFKLRGAMAKLAALGDAAARGVVCGSAGNHAQAVAYAARARGVPCEVFMPDGGADRQGRGRPGARRDAAPARARRSTTRSPPHTHAPVEAGMQFIHPFDDPDVISGQGGVGLELLRSGPGHRPGRGPGRRRRADQRHRDRDQVRAARGRGHRRAGRGLRAVRAHRCGRASRCRSSRCGRSPTASPSNGRASSRCS